MLTRVLFCTIAFTALLSSPSRANYVVNGGFETGNFSGWTTVPASSGSDFGVSTTDPRSGSYAAYFGGTSAGNYDGIYQNLATGAGTFDLDFWLANNGGGSNDFQVYWGGSLVLNISNASSFGYTEYTFDLSTTSSSTQLLFQGYQVPSFFRLDDVSVTYLASVPEPSSLVLLGLGGLLAAGAAIRSARSRSRT